MDDLEKDNQPLQQALIAALGGADQSARTRVYEALVGSRLLVVCAGPPEGDKMSMIAMQDPEGRPVLPVFTTRQALSAWKADAQYHAAVPAPGLFNTAIIAGFEAVVIDPGSSGWVVPQEQFADLAEGRIPEPPPIDQKLVRFEVAAPGEIAEDVLAYVRKNLLPFPQIVGAYFFLGAFSGTPMKLCLGLRLSVPPEHWTSYLQWLSQQVPPAPEGLSEVQYGPVPDEMLAAVEKCALVAFKK